MSQIRESPGSRETKKRPFGRFKHENKIRRFQLRLLLRLRGDLDLIAFPSLGKGPRPIDSLM